MKRLVVSKAAEADLDEIGVSIAVDNPQRAITFIIELEAKAAQAAERPRSFPARDDLGTGVRSALHRPYLVLFEEEEDAVRILRIVHGHRDLGRITLD